MGGTPYLLHLGMEISLAVQVPLDYKADVNAQGHNNYTPIDFISEGSVHALRPSLVA